MFNDLNETIESKLHIAWKSSHAEHLPGPWKDYEFPVLFYLKHGKAVKIFFEDDYSNPLIQPEGTVSIQPPFRKRQIELVAKEKEQRLEMSAIGLSFRLRGNIDLLSFWNIPLLFKAEQAAHINTCMDQLLKLKKHTESTSLLEMINFQKTCMTLLELLTVGTSQKPDSRDKMEMTRSLEPAIKYLRKYFSGNIEVKELAGICNMSRSQFYQKFKFAFGISPIEYQQNLRFSEVRSLLLNTSMPIGEIAFLCGWKDPFHFSRIFKKYYRCSPSEFRYKYKQNPDCIL